MIKKIAGKAFVFGKNIDTDQIYPGRYLALTSPEEIGLHAMEGADPEFAAKAQPGDIIVAGSNFGCGSSREHAVIAIKSVGVGAVMAESFGRIFYRNGINLGLPLLTVPGITTRVEPGDILSLGFEKNIIFNQTSREEIKVEPISEYMLNILESGGIKNLIRKQFNV